jgi:fused signal recognition particle receptor
MFGFLKEKIKEFLGKASSSDLKKPKEIKGEKSRTKGEQAKEIKKQIKTKKERTKNEILQEKKTSEKIIEDIQKENIKIETPEERFEEEIDKELKEKEPEKLSFFEKLKKVFSHTLSERDFEEVFSEIESMLLESNVSLEVIEKIKEEIKLELLNKEIKKTEVEKMIKESLKKAINKILLEPINILSDIEKHKKNSKEPFVILFFGVNGSGKTTSIAKLANLLQKNRISCVLAGADTFRAAAIEQIQIHADALKIKLIKGNYNSDPSSVAFEAIKYAKQHNIDAVLIDTAGRMHTQENLLREMEKICRISKPHLKIFVAESVLGNDATEQAKTFNDLIKIDGSILSKVDVDEKGGSILSIGYVTKKPIFYLGVGQKYKDLELFDKEKFLERLGL